MKPSTLINKVAEVIEALEPSDTSSSVDRFARVTGRQHDEALHGRRLFALRWSDPLPQTPSGTAISCSRYQAGLELAIGYADTAAAQGRLGDDALLVTDALFTVPSVQIIGYGVPLTQFPNEPEPPFNCATLL